MQRDDGHNNHDDEGEDAGQAFGLGKKRQLEFDAVAVTPGSGSTAILMMTQELARLAHDDAVGSVALRGRHRHNRGARAKRHSDIAQRFKGSWRCGRRIRRRG